MGAANSANPVRDAATVTPFPADRIMRAHACRTEIVLVYGGATVIFASVRDLAAWFDDAMPPPPKDDQVVVTHNGTVRTYASPEAFAEVVLMHQRRAAETRRREAFEAAPWFTRLQFLVADGIGILIGRIKVVPTTGAAQ